MENVREFLKWGPLHPCTCGSKDYKKHRKGSKCLTPIKERAGEYFQSFVNTLRGLGRSVEWRIQCAANFSDPTSRERLMLISRADNRPIDWPEYSHYDPEVLAEMPRKERRKLKPWRQAKECIDFDIEGKSVFNNDGTLRHCPNTIRRIIAGFRKFGGDNAGVFIAMLNGTSKSHLESSAQSLNDPLGAVTGANRFYLVDGRLKPFVLNQQSGATARGVDKPMPTICTAGKIRLVEPFITHLTHQCDANDVNGDNRRVHSLRKPMPTVTGARRGELALVEPFIIPKQSKDQPRSTKKPMATITTKMGPMLVESFILPHQRTKKGKDVAPAKSLKKPLQTITGESNGFRLVEPSIVFKNGQRGLPAPIIVQFDNKGANGMYVRPVSKPVATIVTKQNMLLVEPMLVKYYGTGVCQPVSEPLDTVTVKDRFMLVEVTTKQPVAELDIRTRMLQPDELKLAHSFPKHFVLTGTKEDQTKQVGNSVPVGLGRAHVAAVLP